MNKEYPADPTLPLFLAPVNTLSSGKTVPRSATNADGTMNFDDIAWWPVVYMTLMYPNYTTQERVNIVQALMDQMIGEDLKVPSAAAIGLAMIDANPDIDSTAVALITCMFFDPRIEAEKIIIGDSCLWWNNELAKTNAWTAPDLDLDSLGAYVVQSTSMQENWDSSEIAPDWDPETNANYADTYKQIYNSMTGKFGATKKEIEAFSTFAACFFYQGGYDISREAFLACNKNQESRDVFAALRQLDDEIDEDASNSSGEDSNGDDPSGDEESNSDAANSGGEDKSSVDENGSEVDEKENGYYYDGDYDYYPSVYDNDYSPSAYVNPVNTKDNFITDLMAFWDNYLVYNDDDFAQYLYEFPTYLTAKKTLAAAYGIEDSDIWNVTNDSYQ
jgi:hypothetical protein